jgi:hypothetical protein
MQSTRLFAAFLCLAVAGPLLADPPSRDVVVRNGPSEPVPVRQVEPVHAIIDGAVQANFGGVVQVEARNSLERGQRYASTIWATSFGTLSFPAIPTGKRLIITDLSVQGTASATTPLLLKMNTGFLTAGTFLPEYYIPLQQQASGVFEPGARYYTSALKTHLVVDQGAAVSVFFTAFDRLIPHLYDDALLSVVVSVYGVVVDMPVP